MAYPSAIPGPTPNPVSPTAADAGTVRLLSLNRGPAQALRVGQQLLHTAIHKSPCAGPQVVTHEGLAGDELGDRNRHGGDGQALYLFSAEDLAWWSAELGRALAPGQLGDNLTIDRWWPSPRVGDQLCFGTVRLEISFPRIPCATLAAQVGDRQFLRRFVAAGRPGLYARVLHAGVLEAPQTGVLQRGPVEHPGTGELFRLWHNTTSRCPETLQAALRAPIPARARPILRHWLSMEPAPPPAPSP